MDPLYIIIAAVIVIALVIYIGSRKSKKPVMDNMVVLPTDPKELDDLRKQRAEARARKIAERK